MAQGFMIGVGLGVSRAWHTRAKFQAWKHLGGRWGAESLDPGQDGEPQDVREENGRATFSCLVPGCHRASLSRGVYHGKNSFWRRSREQAGQPVQFRLDPQEEGRGTGVWADPRAQGPHTWGTSSFHSLILSGLWGARGCSAPRNARCGEGAQTVLTSP